MDDFEGWSGGLERRRRALSHLCSQRCVYRRRQNGTDGKENTEGKQTQPAIRLVASRGLSASPVPFCLLLVCLCTPHALSPRVRTHTHSPHSSHTRTLSYIHPVQALMQARAQDNVRHGPRSFLLLLLPVPTTLRPTEEEEPPHEALALAGDPVTPRKRKTEGNEMK